MKKLSAAFSIFALFAILAAASTASAQQETTVEKINVKVNVKAPAPPDPIKQKIDYSIQQVGIKALQGKTLSEAEEIKPDLTPLMEKIFNQVLAGYKVDNVAIKIGRSTSIVLDIEPEEPYMSDIDVSIVFEGAIHPLWEQLLAPDLKEIRAALMPAFSAVPVSSGQWAAKPLADMIPSIIALDKYFPGFDVEPTLEIGDRGTLKLHLKARGETVRSAGLKIRSSTMPILMLEKLRYEAAVRSDLLIGLPVKFALLKRELILADLTSYLNESGVAKNLYLDLQIKLAIGRNSRVTIIAESTRYSGFVRGKIKIGTEARNPEIDGHLGVFALKRVELFTELNFLPGPIELPWNVGAGYRLNSNMYAAVGRNVVDGINRIWLNAYLTEDIIVSWEKGVVKDHLKHIEGSITLKAHDYFSFSITTDFKTDVWLGVNANL